MYLSYIYDPDIKAWRGLPGVTTLIHGVKIRDLTDEKPGGGSPTSWDDYCDTAWDTTSGKIRWRASSNPPSCIAHWLMDDVYGCGLDSSYIDFDSFRSAAIYCYIRGIGQNEKKSEKQMA